LGKEEEMSDYKIEGNRYTAIYVIEPKHGGGQTYRKVPFEIVRFNVDANPSAPEVIVPTGEDVLNVDGVKADHEKVYEKIWIVDALPFKAKTSVGPVE